MYGNSGSNPTWDFLTPFFPPLFLSFIYVSQAQISPFYGSNFENYLFESY